MTYRKLYLWLLTGASTVVAILWWASCFLHSGFVYLPDHRPGIPGKAVVGVFFLGTISLGHGGEMVWPRKFEIGFMPAPLRMKDDDEFSRDVKEAGVMGAFRLGRGTPIGLPKTESFRLVEFPIWFPLFLLALGGHLHVRRLEKRSAMLMEKTLAERQRTDQLTSGPPVI